MLVSKALIYRFVVSMLDDAEQQRQLLDELEVHPVAAQHPLDDRVPIEKLDAAHHRLAALSGDDFVSWRFGFQFEPDTLGVLGVLWQHASCLEDMLALHVKFLGVLMDAVTAEFVPIPGGRQIEWSPNPAWERQDPIAVQREHEAAIGFFSKAIQAMTGEPLMPLAISMKRARPETYPDAFAPYLDLTTFNSDRHAIGFRDDDLGKPLVGFNPHVLGSMAQYLESVLATLQRQRGFAAKVEQQILQAFPGELLTVEQAAERFHMSTRSFQRRLVAEGASFRDILNRVKQDVAEQQLRDTDLSVGEIGFLLGYTEPSAFVRFFKKQCGASPSAFRADPASRKESGAPGP